MMRRPPQWSFLHGRRSQQAQQKLKKAGGLVAAMGKITVKAACNPKTPSREQEQCDSQGDPTESNPKDQQNRSLDHEEWNATRPINSFFNYFSHGDPAAKRIRGGKETPRQGTDTWDIPLSHPGGSLRKRWQVL